MKSNGSGPYCVPVGSNGTGTSGSGSNTSVSWYLPKGEGGLGGKIQKQKTTEVSPTGSKNSHIYENYVTDETTVNKDTIDEETPTQLTHAAIIHQESFENEAFLTNSQLESPILSYPQYSQEILEGSESPPLECNKTLLSSKSDRTM